MAKWIFLGPPGAGKGTQARRLARERSALHLSTGDLLRDAIEADSEVGQQAKAYMDEGGLVPDGVILDLVFWRLGQETESRDVIFDGFPRTVAQAEGLDERLGQAGDAVKKTLEFTLADEVIVRRIAGRLICKKCGANFHRDFLPPKREGVCDQCGAEALYQRKDDHPDVVRHRLEIYHQQAQPLRDYYAAQGKLVEIAADAPVETIYERLHAEL
ncbi:MAG: adenylate kinase [Planctomycetota bacterium]